MIDELSQQQFDGMKQAYESALTKYIQEHPHFFTDKYALWKSRFGRSLMQIESLAYYLREEGWPEYMARGCISCQDQTGYVLSGYLNSEPIRYWTVTWLKVGRGFEHHAVAVHPSTVSSFEGEATSDPPWEGGTIFDPWLEQSPQTYPFAEWKAMMSFLEGFGEIRAEPNLQE